MQQQSSTLTLDELKAKAAYHLEAKESVEASVPRGILLFYIKKKTLLLSFPGPLSPSGMFDGT
jgi:hypothetical protein